MVKTSPGPTWWSVRIVRSELTRTTPVSISFWASVLDFTEAAGVEDFRRPQHGVEVIIDPFSAAHLHGTTIDYSEGLEGSGHSQADQIVADAIERRRHQLAERAQQFLASCRPTAS